jgi:hypothetical protein
VVFGDLPILGEDRWCNWFVLYGLVGGIGYVLGSTWWGSGIALGLALLVILVVVA